MFVNISINVNEIMHGRVIIIVRRNKDKKLFYHAHLKIYILRNLE